MHEAMISRTYKKELFGALAVYAVLLMLSIGLGRPMEPGLMRTLVLLSPMLGMLLAAWAIVRQVCRSDEFIRKTTLENIAGAAALTACMSFSYGFLETAGYPRMSMFSVWVVMGFAWLLIGCLRHWFNRA